MPDYVACVRRNSDDAKFYLVENEDGTFRPVTIKALATGFPTKEAADAATARFLAQQATTENTDGCDPGGT